MCELSDEYPSTDHFICSFLEASSKRTLTYFCSPFIQIFTLHHDQTMSDKSQVPADATGGGIKPLVGFLGPQASYTHQVGTTNLKKRNHTSHGICQEW